MSSSAVLLGSISLKLPRLMGKLTVAAREEESSHKSAGLSDKRAA